MGRRKDECRGKKRKKNFFLNKWIANLIVGGVADMLFIGFFSFKIVKTKNCENCGKKTRRAEILATEYFLVNKLHKKIKSRQIDQVKFFLCVQNVRF